MTDLYSQLLLIEDDPAVARGLQDGLERDGFRVTWKSTGAEGIEFLTKPFSLRELLSRIRAQLRRAYGDLSSVDANLLYAGDLVIEQTRGQALRGDQVLNLTPSGPGPGRDRRS